MRHPILTLLCPCGLRRAGAAAALALTLSGCSTLIPYYQQGFAIAVGLQNQATADRQAYHDQQMKLSLDLVCDNSIGAIGRLQDDVSRDYILRHCGIVSGVLPSALTGGAGSAVSMRP